MKRVFKYEIPMKDLFFVDMPKNAEILCVQVQREQPCFWALINPLEENERYVFRLAGTGHPIDEKVIKQYIGTFQMADGDLVFHLFLET